MKSVLLATAFLFCLLASPIPADGPRGTCRLQGRYHNTKGEPMAGLTMHFYKPAGPPGTPWAQIDHRTTTTAADGSWSIDLPPGDWRGAVRPDDLLVLGYFCAPGIAVCLDMDPQGNLIESPCRFDAWPPLWGAGGVEWELVRIGEITSLTAVPTRPSLTITKMPQADASLIVSFETPSAGLVVLNPRQWRIEKSADLQTWTPLTTVSLGSTSPLVVPDPNSHAQTRCIYRAVLVE